MKRLYLLFLLLPVIAYGSHLDTSQHSVQLGGSANTGNSENTNINAKISSILQHDPWGYEALLEGQLASSRGIQSAQSVKSTGKITYDLSEKTYLFFKGGIIYDKFGTFDFVVREAGGLGRILFKDSKKELTVEVGPGGIHRRIAGTNDFQNQPMLSAAGEYIVHLSETAEFKQTVSTDVSRSNTHIETVTALKTHVVKNLALELSFKMNHDTVIPMASINKKKTDTSSIAALIYTF